MFKNPFSFKGRIRRTEYGLSYIIYIIALYGGAFFLSFIPDEKTIGILYFILILPLLWFLLAQGAKRCHDRGNSGFFQLIPFYGLWMLFGDSDYGPNRYGSNPKGLGNIDEIDEIGTPMTNSGA